MMTLILLAILSLGHLTIMANDNDATFTSGDETTIEFTTKGSCGMCKTRIENAAKEAGATTAVWDLEEQKVKVVFDASKTSAKKIQKAIAKSGHDTAEYRADDETYAKLPGCCKYERIPKE